MKRMIRNRANKAFLAEGGNWTSDYRCAQAFTTYEDARKALANQKVKDVEWYYMFGDEPSEYDFTVVLSL
jgi:hypothetical protein